MIQFSKIIFCISLLTSLFSFSAYGQILNIEKARLDSLKKKKPYRINFESKLNFYNRSASANEQAKFTSITNELDAIVAPGKHSYILLGKLSYTENNSKSILNNGYLHFRSNFYYRSRWSFESYGQLQYDKFRGLSDRYLLGAGARWRAYQDKKFMFGFGTGPMYENEIWNKQNESGYTDVKFLKLSTYMIARWDISDNIHSNTIFYYQTGYDRQINTTRNRISSSTNINIKISTFLAYSVSVTMAFEDKPIIPITRFIYEIENGLILTF